MMTSVAKKVLDDALALPENDRRRVAEELLDSVPQETPEALEQAWNQEAVRRGAALERGELEALDGDKALGQLEARLLSGR